VRYENAQAHFSASGYGFGENKKKLPTIKTLREEYGKLNTTKKQLWQSYHNIKNENKDYEVAYKNIKLLLNLKPQEVESML